MPHLIPRARMAVTATQTALTPQAAAKRTQRRCHRPPQTCPPCLDLIPHLMLRRRRPLALARPPCLDLIPHWMPRRRRPLALLARPPLPGSDTPTVDAKETPSTTSTPPLPGSDTPTVDA